MKGVYVVWKERGWRLLVVMECLRGWVLVLFLFLVFLFVSFVGVVDEVKWILIILEGFFKLYMKKFDINLCIGSDDLFLYDL